MTEYDPDKLTFGQRNGLEALPTQLKLGEVTQEMRARLWAPIQRRISIPKTGYRNRINDEWHYIMEKCHVEYLHRYSDEFSSQISDITRIYKIIISNGSYVEIFNFIEFILKYDISGLSKELNKSLEDCRAPYRVIDDKIIPYASEEEGKAIQTAFNALKQNEHNGARQHLLNAGSLLSGGKWSDSVRESIHAVEAVARLIEPTGNNLGKALSELEKKSTINPNFKRGVNALYDYTSDEDGIRHAKVFDQESNVGETEALFMFGACASFITYLIRKHDGV